MKKYKCLKKGFETRDLRHLEHHQASPDRAAMRLSLVGLVRDVASRHMDPVCVVESGLQHGPATSWPQHGQLRRDGM